jgi:hypothetical protein
VRRWAGTGDRGRKTRREEHNGGLDEVAEEHGTAAVWMR